MKDFGLYDYQMEAVRKLKSGSILVGGVGSGKSRTSLAYYMYGQLGELGEVRGEVATVGNFHHIPSIHAQKFMDLVIITTAKKRDSREWESDMIPFGLTTQPNGIYNHKVVVDSWNNIGKYASIKGAFFIFDEQRVVGKGAWVKAFLKITKDNPWILLSATPGDTWEDYTAVFIANGFFKNITQYHNEHFEYDRWSKFPKVKCYHNTRRLERLRDLILVPMDFERQTIAHHIDIPCSYDQQKYREVGRTRWNFEKDEPIKTASEFCALLRKIVNTDDSRKFALLDILEKHPGTIVFYNYDYELYDLLALCDANDIPVAQWNGHKHEPIPEGDRWVYLCQYNAGAEGWNCIRTNCLIFYSANYSYKIMTQAAGRIDRMNTPYKELYYYHFKSKANIDLAIERAIREKKKFNEGSYIKKRFNITE